MRLLDRIIRLAWICVVVYALGMLARGGAAALEAWKTWP